MKRTWTAIALAAAVFAAPAGQEASAGADAAPGRRMLVVSTAFAPYDWVRTLSGGKAAGRVEAVLLSGGGGDMHSFRPTVADMARIAECDILLCIGGVSETWLEKALAAGRRNPGRKVLRLMDILGDRAKDAAAPEGCVPGHRHRHRHGQAHAKDEHIWLSLKNAELFSAEIAKALAASDPGGTEAYAANAAVFRDRLRALDGRYAGMVANAARRTILVADRFPFRYLAEDYGISYFAAFAGCSAESESSFAAIAFLAGKADALSLPVILVADGSRHRLAEAVAAETKRRDVKILRLDSMQSAAGAASADYLGTMERNLEVLRQALCVP